MSMEIHLSNFRLASQRKQTVNLDLLFEGGASGEKGKK